MMILLDWASIIFLSFACSSFLFIWFNTNAIYEYLNYFNIGGKYLAGYNQYRKKDYASLLFIPYLLVNHNCFFTKLICCSICVSFWINVIFNLIFSTYYNIPISFALSLLIYYTLVILKGKIENA
jgi:hypothetical protein